MTDKQQAKDDYRANIVRLGLQKTVELPPVPVFSVPKSHHLMNLPPKGPRKGGR